MRRLSVLLLIVAALVAPATAHAVPKDHPWATINVCDTDGPLNAVGIRAGMPGNGTDQAMRMRFELQWYRPAKHRYVRLGDPSAWIDAGPARFRLAQRGWTFLRIPDPAAGERIKLRGLVHYQWRERRPAAKGSKRKRLVVVRGAKRITHGGLRGVVGGRPPGRSEAVCLAEGPAPPDLVK